MDELFAHLNDKQWLVLTGAGISADSGLPTYRNEKGDWQRRPPVTHQQFIQQPVARQRFWARNLVGWRFVAAAKPNAAHHCLARLEESGRVRHLVTQNVDGLHQRAGSTRVIDLHGRLDRVICLQCNSLYPRDEIQIWLERKNPEFSDLAGAIAPDGDASVDDLDFSALQVPHCDACGGVLKPDAVFFGDSVPAERVASVGEKLAASDGLLVIGSSLTAFSGYRFCLQAQKLGHPIVILNAGTTRADHLARFKLDQPCARPLQLWLNST